MEGELVSDELTSLRAHREQLQARNVFGMSIEERCALTAELVKVTCRIEVLEAKFKHEAWWRALSDEQRLELVSSCCRGCGKLETAEGRRCQCWNDE